jgi:hypothetical protein
VLALWSALIGAASGFVAGLPTAIAADSVARDVQGIAVASLLAATDAGMLIGPLVMGTLADVVGLSAPFIGSGILLAALAAWCATSRRAGVAAAGADA